MYCVVVFFQVIASDVNQDGLLEILAIDNSGNIACKSLNGKMVSVELLTFQVNVLINLQHNLFIEVKLFHANSCIHVM